MSDPSPQQLLQQALAEIQIHVRLQEQALVPEGSSLEPLSSAIPELLPFSNHRYAKIRVVLDWDHQIPCQMAYLRIFAVYTEQEAKRLDEALLACTQGIANENLYPEFDLPDYSQVDANEIYVGLIRPGADSFDEFRFFASWRKDVPPPLASTVIKTVKQLDSYKLAYAQRDKEGLGPPILIGWSPPCLAKSEHWAVEVWLLTEFDGRRGKAKLFMVDSGSMQVTFEDSTDVHTG